MRLTSREEFVMTQTAFRIAGLSVVSALAVGVGSANAQLLTHKDLSIEMATTIARAVLDTCKSQGYNVSVNVLGREGQVVLAARGDSAGFNTMENSMKKAYTARTMRRPSGEFADAVKDNPTAGALFLTNIVPARGALPIKVGDDVIGSVGVSGAPGGDKDEACAKAGIDKVSADLK
jgi:uncharacterized protein GlcG (DUF336 family)